MLYVLSNNNTLCEDNPTPGFNFELKYNLPTTYNDMNLLERAEKGTLSVAVRFIDKNRVDLDIKANSERHGSGQSSTQIEVIGDKISIKTNGSGDIAVPNSGPNIGIIEKYAKEDIEEGDGNNFYLKCTNTAFAKIADPTDSDITRFQFNKECTASVSKEYLAFMYLLSKLQP